MGPEEESTETALPDGAGVSTIAGLAVWS